MKFICDDGGRLAAGFTGRAGDCVARAIAIATGKPYAEIYIMVNAAGREEKEGKNKGKRSTARNGVIKKTTRKILESMGWKYVPCMAIGSGCKVHLREGELPMGRLIVQVSKHLTAVIDGEVHDTYDPQREAGRCVYGYWVVN